MSIKHTDEGGWDAVISYHPLHGGGRGRVGDEGEDEGDIELMLLALTAPHDCDDPECPGAINKRKLEAFEAHLP